MSESYVRERDDFPAEEEEDASEDDFPAEEMDGAGDALPEELAERFRQIREEQERQLDQEAAAARERKLETQRRRQLNERLEESKRRRVHCQLAKVNVRAASARPHTAASQGPLRPGGRRPSCSPDAGVPYSRDDHLMGWDFDGMMEAVGACDGALRGRGSKQLTECTATRWDAFTRRCSLAAPRSAAGSACSRCHGGTSSSSAAGPCRGGGSGTLTLLGAKFGLHSHPGDFPFVAEIMEGFVAADPPCCGTTSTHSIPAAGIGTAAPTAESISEHGGRQWLGAHLK